MNEKPKRGQTLDQNSSSIAIILIAVGAIFLLGNIGLFAGIGRLWPLIPVGIGIWMLYGKNAPTATIKRGQFTAPLDEATSAEVKLNFSVAETTVQSATDPALLLDADLTYVGDIHFVNDGTTQKYVSLSQSGGSFVQWLNPA